jgi:hypothetical protein
MVMVDLDAVTDVLSPWTHEVKSEGRVYATRPPSVGEAMMLGKLGELTDAQGMQLVRGLFAGEIPDVSAWRTEKVLAFVASYLSEVKRSVQKNSQAVAALYGAATAKSGPAVGATAATA